MKDNEFGLFRLHFGAGGIEHELVYRGDYFDCLNLESRLVRTGSDMFAINVIVGSDPIAVGDIV